MFLDLGYSSGLPIALCPQTKRLHGPVTDQNSYTLKIQTDRNLFAMLSNDSIRAFCLAKLNLEPKSFVEFC